MEVDKEVGPYLPICIRHILPPSGPFNSNSTLGSFRSKILSNDRTRCLHVQEELSKRSLGCIRIMLSLLALLLLSRRGIGSSSSTTTTGNPRGTDRALQVGEAAE